MSARRLSTRRVAVIPANVTQTRSSVKPPLKSGQGVKRKSEAARAPPATVTKRISFNNTKEYDDYDDKENQRGLPLNDYLTKVKEKCVLTDRWMVWEPQFDSSRGQLAALIMEIDKTVEGDLRSKRCVKIFQDRSYQVLIDNVDMTQQFDHISTSKKLETTYDSDKLIHALITKKVCQGLRTYDPTNPILAAGNLPVKQRGKLWYSKDCTIIVTKAFMGNSCNSCLKIRNHIRKAMQTENRKKSKPVKQVKSTFGKALFSLLNDFSGRGPIPPSQYERDNMVYDEKMGIHISFELHQRLFLAATMPPPPSAYMSKSRNRKNRNRSGRRFPEPTSTVTSEGYPVQQFITEDGQLCYLANVVDSVTGEVHQVGMPMTVEKIEPPEITTEYITLSDGTVVQVQNIEGHGFQLADGQEYEVIGEAPTINTTSIEPIEIVPADGQNIQIIEVDESTMQQIEHPNENMQIAAVDPNDPNLSQLFRAFQSQIQGLAL